MMQRLSAKSMLHTLLLTVSAVVVCLLHPALSNAASPKVDVCHREGNGSFHLTTVAYQAVQAHRNHGDALPGEPVPGNPGAIFDDTCAQVAASVCPCDFSLTGLADVGIDGSIDEGLKCYEGATREIPQLTSLYTTNAPRLEASTGASFCQITQQLPQGGFIILEEVTSLTTPQIAACAADLRKASQQLGANPPCR
jgi:hypothetical protein